jgi:ABC-type Na+ efflux pump permease subunit
VRFLVASAVKDLRRRLADPPALSIWVGFPLLLGILLSLLAVNGQNVPTARILLVNEDDSPFTAFLVRALERGSVGEDVLFEFDEVDLETGRERIGDGDGTALLILPPDFGAALLDEKPATLTLITNPAETILPAIVIEGLDILRDGAFYAQRVLGEPIRGFAAGPPPGQDVFDSAVVASFAAEINDRIAAAGNLFDPPLFTLDFGDDDEADPSGGGVNTGFSIARFILPGLILMSVLFITQGTSDDIWIEKDRGTLSRAFCTPRPLAAFVAGKMLAGLLLIAAVATMALMVAVVAFDVPLAKTPLALLWCTYAGAGLFGLFLFVTMLGTSHRASTLIMMMVLFPLMMLGGSFLPFESMPAWMRAVGVWTPNGMAVEQLNDWLFGSPDPAASIVAAAAIAAIGGVSLWLCALRARTFVAR